MDSFPGKFIFLKLKFNNLQKALFDFTGFLYLSVPAILPTFEASFFIKPECV